MSSSGYAKHVEVGHGAGERAPRERAVAYALPEHRLAYHRAERGLRQRIQGSGGSRMRREIVCAWQS